MNKVNKQPGKPRGEILLKSGELRDHDEVRYSISIGEKNFDVFFRSSDITLYSGVEPALPLALLGAMRTGSDLRILSPVSKTYVRNVQKVTNIFTGWFPEFSKVAIHADSLVTASPVATGRVGLFFSGGVDSFNTLLHCVDQITDLIYIHGFDVRLDDYPRRWSIKEMGKTITQATGIRFIEIETNVSKILQTYGEWAKHGHGMALVSVGRLLQGYVNQIYIASGVAYQDLKPWGSHPATDPLYSDEALTFIHHGCEKRRTERIEFIKDSALAMSHLRVCWEHLEGRYNCCECEKCLRTMTILDALGVLDSCTAFRSGIDIRKLRGLIWKRIPPIYLNENIRFLEDHGLANSEVYRAYKHLKRWSPWLGGGLQKYRQIRKKFTRGIKQFFDWESHPRSNSQPRKVPKR